MATSDLRELILSARHCIVNAKQDPVAAIHRDEFLDMIRAARSRALSLLGSETIRCGVGSVWLSDCAACANTTLSVEFRDNTRLPRVLLI